MSNPNSRKPKAPKPRKIHWTRSYVRNNPNLPNNAHPWLNHPLPSNDRTRGPTQEGHPGAIHGDFVDDGDDIPSLSLGEVKFPDNNKDGTTHIRSISGGYVNIWTKKEWASRVEYLKWSRQWTKRQQRNTRIGSERRRWVWRNGKPAGRGGKGKKTGVDRRRDDKGRFV